MDAPAKRQPVVFLGHGGGPMFLIKGTGAFETGDKNSRAVRELSAVWSSLYGGKRPLYESPKAILVVSAHWESGTGEFEVFDQDPSDPAKLFFDYYGFPKETYEVEYPCPVDPALNARVAAKLQAAGLKSRVTRKREGLDHGVFIPLKVIYPKADLPVAQVSLSSLDATEQMRMGQALASLRDEGVLIIGSGMLVHNFGGAGPSSSEDYVAHKWAANFQEWVDEVFASPGTPESRLVEAVRDWATLAPGARLAHPREEHLLPFFTALGAAGLVPARKTFQTWMAGAFPLNFYIWD